MHRGLHVNLGQFRERQGQWRRKVGAKGGMRPGRHCAGGGIWRGENAEFGNSAASGGELAFRLHCRTDSAVSLVGYSTQLHCKISVLFTVHTNPIVVPVPIRISIADLIRGGGRRQHRRLPRAAKTLAPPLDRADTHSLGENIVHRGEIFWAYSCTYSRQRVWPEPLVRRPSGEVKYVLYNLRTSSRELEATTGAAAHNLDEEHS